MQPAHGVGPIEVGQILTSGRLAASIEDIAELEDLGEREMRGMTRPVSVWNIKALKG